MRWMPLFILAVVAGAGLGVPSEAAAWTRSVVQSADATVTVAPDASVEVLLDLRIDVHAGWLRELIVAGLGNDVSLDTRRPPYFRSEDGEVFRPEAELTDEGSIRLQFERRGAPRKGEYRVLVRYRARADAELVPGSDDVMISWSLPAWETGLHDISVDIRAPLGSNVPIELRDPSPGIELTTHARPRATQMIWRRIHLPRHTPWRLSFHAPRSAMQLPADQPTPVRADGFEPLAPRKSPTTPWAMLAFALAVVLKRRAIEVTLGRRTLLLRAPWSVVATLVAALLIVVTLVAPNHALLAVPLLALVLHRASSRASIPPETGWERSSPTSGLARETPLSDLLDATRPAGLFVLTALGAAVTVLGEPLLAVAMLPLFATGTRHHRPPSARESAEILARFVAAIKVPEDAPPMGFRWESRADGACRCRVVLPRERAGLWSLSLTTATRNLGCVAKRDVVLLVQTRAQSDADDLVRRATGVDPAYRTEDGRLGRLVPWGPYAISLIRSLECRATPRPLRKSTGSWLLRKMTERHSKAA